MESFSSFSFSKKSETKKIPLKSAFGDSLEKSDKDENKVSFIEAGKIDGRRNEAEETKELIIPLIPNRQIFIPGVGEDEGGIRPPSSTETLDNAVPLTLEEQAKKELLLDSGKSAEDRAYEEEAKKTLNLLIPVENKNDDILDVTHQPEKPTDEDYEQVPVTAYGQAMLRGMGWSQGNGIGNRNKGVIKPVEVPFRPKGLGLGALPKKIDASKQKKSEKSDEVLEITKGKYVLVLNGANKGFYGQVESVDGNTGRVVVKLAIQNQTVSLSENILQPVSTEEYKKSFRVLNKDKYDEHKAMQEKERESKEDRRSKRHRRRSRSGSRDERSRSTSKDRRRRRRSRSKEKRSRSRETKSTKLWVRPLLRVRCIDPDYRRGMYFKKKVVIIDVVSYDIVVCKAEDGKLLEDIHPTKLESVIPKDTPSYVMVVRGKHSGEVAEIQSRDKRKCLATVQILPDREKVLELSYDDICEYVGEVE